MMANIQVIKAFLPPIIYKYNVLQLKIGPFLSIKIGNSILPQSLVQVNRNALQINFPCHF